MAAACSIVLTMLRLPGPRSRGCTSGAGQPEAGSAGTRSPVPGARLAAGPGPRSCAAVSAGVDELVLAVVAGHRRGVAGEGGPQLVAAAAGVVDAEDEREEAPA